MEGVDGSAPSDILIYITYAAPAASERPLEDTRSRPLIINPGDEMPIYRQIMRQVQEAIVEGRMQSGDKLMSHRELAAELVIAPLTVKRAYDELERLGLIATERGRGTFVTGSLPQRDREESLERVRRLAERLLTEARINAIDHARVLEIIEEARKRGGA